MATRSSGGHLCREVVTLYDLEQYLCQLLRVDAYERLQMGPLLRAPVVVQHFSPPANLLKVPKVAAGKNILTVHAWLLFEGCNRYITSLSSTKLLLCRSHTPM